MKPCLKLRAAPRVSENPLLLEAPPAQPSTATTSGTDQHPQPLSPPPPTNHDDGFSITDDGQLAITLHSGESVLVNSEGATTSNTAPPISSPLRPVVPGSLSNSNQNSLVASPSTSASNLSSLMAMSAPSPTAAARLGPLTLGSGSGSQQTLSSSRSPSAGSLSLSGRNTPSNLSPSSNDNSDGPPPSEAPSPSQGKIKWEDLRIGHIIGRGAQAVVRKAKHTQTGTIYALKCFDLGESQFNLKKSLQMELARLSGVSHSNLVGCIDAYFNDYKLKMLMEYMNLGTLSSLITKMGPVPMHLLSHMMLQVVNGLQYLHSLGIVHRDLKPSNLLLNKSGEVKIADFGVSTILKEEDHTMTRIGSTAYMSPERIRGDPYGIPSDYWSVGVTCAECALGVFPFYPEGMDISVHAEENPFTQDINIFDLSMVIAENAVVIEWNVLIPSITKFRPQFPAPDVSLFCKDFASECLHSDPKKRPTAADLLMHPFITDKPSGGIDFKSWIGRKCSMSKSISMEFRQDLKVLRGRSGNGGTGSGDLSEGVAGLEGEGSPTEMSPSDINLNRSLSDF